MKKTLVLGASLHINRYSNRAIKMLQMAGNEVVGIGIRSGKVEYAQIYEQAVSFANIHTVSVYMNPRNQQPFYNYIIALHPRRVIFNPGSENPAFEKLLRRYQIFFERSCTLVLLRTNQF